MRTELSGYTIRQIGSEMIFGKIDSSWKDQTNGSSLDIKFGNSPLANASISINPASHMATIIARVGNAVVSGTGVHSYKGSLEAEKKEAEKIIIDHLINYGVQNA